MDGNAEQPEMAPRVLAPCAASHAKGDAEGKVFEIATSGTDATLSGRGIAAEDVHGDSGHTNCVLTKNRRKSCDFANLDTANKIYEDGAGHASCGMSSLQEQLGADCGEDKSSLARLIRIEKLLSTLMDVPQQLAGLNEKQQQMLDTCSSAKQVSNLTETCMQLCAKVHSCTTPTPPASLVERPVEKLAERIGSLSQGTGARASAVGLGRRQRRSQTNVSNVSSQADKSAKSGEHSEAQFGCVVPSFAPATQRLSSNGMRSSEHSSVGSRPPQQRHPRDARERTSFASNVTSRPSQVTSYALADDYAKSEDSPSVVGGTPTRMSWMRRSLDERVLAGGESPSPRKVDASQAFDAPSVDLPGATGSESPHASEHSEMPKREQSRGNHCASSLSLGGGALQKDMIRSATALAGLQHLIAARPKAPILVLLPNDRARIVLDAVVVLTTVLAGILIPFGLTYLESGPICCGAFSAVLHAINCVFALDIVANFRTSFVDVDGLELRPRYIFFGYLRRGFVLDLLTAWPVALAPGRAERTVWALKLLRLSRVVPLIAKLQKELNFKALAWLRIGIVVALLCHVLSCAWRLSLRADGSEDDSSWPDLYVEDAYWVLMTMTTVGYGDISPQGTKSRLYALLAMVISPIFFGAIVSALTHTTRSLFDDRTEEIITEVTTFMEARRLPMDVQQRVQRNLRNYLQKEHSKAMDPKFFALLSPSMQRELSLALVSSTVLQFPLFRGAQHSFVAEIAQAHTLVECLAGDVVAEEGQLVQELVFVMLGRLTMQLPPLEGSCDRTREFEIETGAWFGEGSLFGQGCVRDGTIVAILDSELAVLKSREYIRVVRKFPRLMEKHLSIQAALKNGSLKKESLAWRRPSDDTQHLFRRGHI